MMDLDLLDDNDLSDISLDFSPEAEDSGIDACEGGSRARRNYDLESSSESERERERDIFLKHVQFRNMLQNYNFEERFDFKKCRKLYEPITVEQLERMGKLEECADDESILEVELTASGEDDDSSVLELVIPMQKKKFPKRSGLGVFQSICKFFCCKPMK